MSLKSGLHESLRDLEASITALLASYAPSAHCSSDDVSDRLLGVLQSHDKLTVRMQELEAHQLEEKVVESLRSQIAETEMETRKLVARLLETEAQLQSIRDDLDYVLSVDARPQQTKASTSTTIQPSCEVSLSTLIAYSQQLRVASVAPGWWREGLDLGANKRPWPRKEIEISHSVLWGKDRKAKIEAAEKTMAEEARLAAAPPDDFPRPPGDKDKDKDKPAVRKRAPKRAREERPDEDMILMDDY